MNQFDYTNNGTKWKAYQFLDPFSEGKFYVGLRNAKIFCNPNCEAHGHPVDEEKEVKFFNTFEDALKDGYTACDSCRPNGYASEKCRLAVQCMNTINKEIDFFTPENVWGWVIEYAQGSGSNPVTSGAGHSHNNANNNRLVTILSCRRIAYAAAENYVKEGRKMSVASISSEEFDDKKNGKRKRGGLVGFKELAEKAKLSCWHFHRVFKTITGLTPKNYGDRCTQYFSFYHDQLQPQTQTPPSSSTLMHSAMSGPVLSNTSLSSHAAAAAAAAAAATSSSFANSLIEENDMLFSNAEIPLTFPDVSSSTSSQTSHHSNEGLQLMQPFIPTPHASQGLIAVPHMMAMGQQHHQQQQQQQQQQELQSPTIPITRHSFAYSSGSGSGMEYSAVPNSAFVHRDSIMTDSSLDFDSLMDSVFSSSSLELDDDLNLKLMAENYPPENLNFGMNYDVLQGVALEHELSLIQ